MGKLGKHDHKLTNLLKAGIFSLIMLAPLIAIGVKCLYVINNKNAYESYTGNLEVSVKTTLDTQNYTNLPTGDMFTYYFTDINSYPITTSYSGWFNFENCNYPNLDTRYTRFRVNFGLQILQFNYETTYDNLSFTNFTFNLTSFTNSDRSLEGLSNIFYFTYVNTTTLDNVFYNAVEDIENNNLFTWTKNTAIYTPLNAMCSGLGITESAIPILLTYWALMTLNYIVFDIIIYLFTKMTHFLGTN